MFATKRYMNFGPAFRMREKDYFTIIEGCCYLGLSLKKFKSLRDDLLIYPVDKSRPYEFHRKSIERMLSYLILMQLLNLDKKHHLDPPSDAEAFYRFHLYAASINFCYIDKTTLAIAFAKAMRNYNLTEREAA